jgi:hypothetical protein
MKLSRQIPAILSLLKPGVNKNVLLFIAGLLWLAVGTMLLIFAISWLQHVPQNPRILLAAIGVILALFIHHFGFLKVVDKNLRRISPMEGKQCVFSFMSAKSYLLVAVMVGIGYLLRHSPLPKPYLAVMYSAIGLALILSSVRYMRVLIRQLVSSNLAKPEVK